MSGALRRLLEFLSGREDDMGRVDPRGAAWRAIRAEMKEGERWSVRAADRRLRPRLSRTERKQYWTP